MSPEKKRDFEREWPQLAQKLHRLLARKKVPVTRREDVVQEVAVRLLSVWHKVDRTRPPWPLTVTIALNLLRDDARRNAPAEVHEMPELAGPVDVERAGLARIELEQVRIAMASLSTAQRNALLREVGDASAGIRSASAEKMLRSRARKRLNMLVRDVSAVVALRARRITEWVQSLFAIKESVGQNVTCLICILFGLGVGVVPQPPSGTIEPSARNDLTMLTQQHTLATSDEGQIAAMDMASLRPLDNASSAAAAAERELRAAANRRASGREAEGAPGAGDPAGDLSLPSANGPDLDGVPQDVPGTPPLPEQGDTPTAPDAPDSPDTPEVHPPDAPSDQPDVPMSLLPVAEIADDLIRG